MCKLRPLRVPLAAAIGLTTLVACGGGSSDATGSPPVETPPTDSGWQGVFGAAHALSDSVSALAVFDDGRGEALFVGGRFTHAGGNEVNHIARWDGAAWESLDQGLNFWVTSLAVFDDGTGEALYAGGLFTAAGALEVRRVARWDGLAWSSVSTGANDIVSAMAVVDLGTGPALFVGGDFTEIGGQNASRVARWNGSAWSPLGFGMENTVLALLGFDDGQGAALYAGGAFFSAGSAQVSRVARWNGVAWSELDGGVNKPVRALAVFDEGSGEKLFVAGGTTKTGGDAAVGIARWDGEVWSALDAGIQGDLFALLAHDDGSGPALYAGGAFAKSADAPGDMLVRWTGTAWESLGEESLVAAPGGAVKAFAIYDDGTGPALFVGGDFTQSPEGDAHLAKWVGFEPPVALIEASSSDSPSEEPKSFAGALSAALDGGTRFDSPGTRLRLRGHHTPPREGVQWLAGDLWLEPGTWHHGGPLTFGVSGPARLVIPEGATLHVPQLFVGPEGKLVLRGALHGTATIERP